MTIKPITPSEALLKFGNDLPEKVLVAWNDIIVRNLKGNTSIVKQDDIVSILVNVMDTPRNFVFEMGWLEIEELYRKAGWKVEYDKPAYNDTYGATFTFTIPNRNYAD